MLEESLVEVDCFKYLGLQVAADGGCERMWYTDWMRSIECEEC